jgi:hypothetical protein
MVACRVLVAVRQGPPAPIRGRAGRSRGRVFRSSSGYAPAARAESVALVAHRIDDATDLAQRHTVHGFLGGPGGHRARWGAA